MTFKLLPELMSPAEGEMTVRSYHTTSLSSGLLGLKAEGFLTVTNLRVVFYAYGTSLADESILQSEVPLADVSGITTYKGFHFSLWHFLIAWVVSALVALIVTPIATGILAVIPGLLHINDLMALLPLLVAGALIFVSRNLPVNRLWRSILATCAALMLLGGSVLGGVTAGFSRFSNNASGGAVGTLLSTIGFVVGIGAVFYAFYCYFKYARRQTMALAIGSKGGSSTPIAISGISGFGLFGGAALRALTAEPAEDVEAMIKELGAMITDIQSLGIDGIDRWRIA